MLMAKETKLQARRPSLRDIINETAEHLIEELRDEVLTPGEKLRLLSTLLPYTMGRLPSPHIRNQWDDTKPSTIIDPITPLNGEDGKGVLRFG